MAKSNRRKRWAKPSVQTREKLEAQHGLVLDENQLAAEYVLCAVIVPGEAVVRRKADNQVGSMRYEGGFYFDFRPQQTAE